MDGTTTMQIRDCLIKNDVQTLQMVKYSVWISMLHQHLQLQLEAVLHTTNTNICKMINIEIPLKTCHIKYPKFPSNSFAGTSEYYISALLKTVLSFYSPRQKTIARDSTYKRAFTNSNHPLTRMPKIPTPENYDR